MKYLITLVLLAVSSVVVADPGAPVSAEKWTHAQPNVQVSVSRGDAEGTYNVSATISDLRTGKVLAEPKLIAAAGQPAHVQAGATGTAGMIAVEFTVTVADAGDVAAYTSQIKDNGVAISSQSATLAVTR